MERSLADRILSVAALVTLAAQAVLEPRTQMAEAWTATGASVAVALLAVCLARPPATSLAVLLGCLAGAERLGWPWQLTMALALGCFALLGRVWPSLRSQDTRLAFGHVPLQWTALVAGVTPIALVCWLLLFRPDLRDVVQAYVPRVSLPLLILGGAGFAIVNATLEELLWRGVIQDRLGPVFGIRGAIALQAISFGLQHARGVPRGVVGVILAGSWAVMLGLLRRHAGGLLAPVLAHVVADATIAAIVLGMVR